MPITINRKFTFGVAMFFHSFIIIAQYTITGGGSNCPLLALDDTPNRLQIWLVYGTENTSLEYASNSSSHTWKRYRTKALEAETLTGAEQAGTTSTLHGIEEGYGYFVEEEGLLPRYIWIIDYSRYAFSIQSLSILNNGDPCNELLLDGELTNPPLFYYTPLGLQRELKRSFEITFNTMEWSAENKLFTQKTITKTIEGNPLGQSLTPPLCDTEITLSGDMFARHFNIENTMRTETFQAIAIEAHIDTIVTNMAGPNMIDGKSTGYSGPLYIQFRPLANEPAANWYRWTICHSAKAEKKDTIRASTVREMDYTFNNSGNYTIILEVSDRTRRCSRTDSISITISESYLSVPNAFTPGVSPGVNDIFKVAYKSLIHFKGWIFNRWGTELFQWTDPAQGWDGKKNGKYVPPGVYFYIIEAQGSDGKNYLEKGHINIIRSKNVHTQITEQ
ncbi:MAG: gliding motility-associated C-terminal domain-containing protein [Tannerellaceae bacterium]|jgi:gliding motility-associated-like protein|nr:gliding motility-associated C-terminal domain-containing protein [Tannerellaceae bacterium]